MVKFLFGLSLICILCSACDEKMDPVVDVDYDGNTDIVSYTLQIKPILDDHCISCHATTAAGSERFGAPLGVNYDTYDVAVDSADGANQRIQAGSMPPAGPLSDDEKALVAQWVDEDTPQ